MIAVSSLLRRVVYPAMSRANLFSHRIGDGEVGVVTYHGILPAGCTQGASPIEGALLTATQFRQHLRFLKTRYHLISPDLFRAWLKDGASLPPRAVLLTCDDGLLNVLTDMIPILLEEGARCLFFVTGRSLEDRAECLWYEELYRMLDDAPANISVVVGAKTECKASWTSKDLSGIWWRLVQEYSVLNMNDRVNLLRSLRKEWHLADDWGRSEDELSARRYHLLTSRELKQLAAQGMTIGAHTLSHPLLSQMPAEFAEQEIRECKTRLESYLQQDVWALAYPFGHEGSAGAREMTMAETSGYDCAFLNCGGGVVQKASARFGLPRAHVSSQMSRSEVEAHLSGFHHSLQRGFRGDGGASLSNPGQGR
ncbi:MAG: polysaccharide deacetylase family protein [Acidobacteria bacterium]|nr:polysaccharide deacetylase family protein [Acidobacteriota bacterium]